MCQSCTPQKLTRTYSKGLVVQILGKPPRPCASPRNSSTATEPPPCSLRSACLSVSSVDKSEKQDQILEQGRVNSPRAGEAKSVKGPSWKIFAGGEQTRLGDGETGESDMDVDTTAVRKPYQGHRCVEANPGDYASKYRTSWC